MACKHFDAAGLIEVQRRGSADHSVEIPIEGSRPKANEVGERGRGGGRGRGEEAVPQSPGADRSADACRFIEGGFIQIGQRRATRIVENTVGATLRIDTEHFAIGGRHVEGRKANVIKLKGIAHDA